MLLDIVSNEKYYCKQIPCKRILLKNENKIKQYAIVIIQSIRKRRQKCIIKNKDTPQEYVRNRYRKYLKRKSRRKMNMRKIIIRTFR